MHRAFLSFALLCFAFGNAMADEPAQGPKTGAEKANAENAKSETADVEKVDSAATSAERYIANPDDMAAFTQFLNETGGPIVKMARDDPAEAQRRLAAMEKVVESVKPQTAEGKTRLSNLQRSMKTLRGQIEILATNLTELEAKLTENPHDLATLSRYVRKAETEIGSLARSEPDAAESMLKTALAHIEKALSAASESEKSQLELLAASLRRYEPSIEIGKSLAARIGKDAAPLEVEAWVNGEPLTDQDLKGKVVLLDFWAVWCGPCIATFPHLREWHEKYAAKGLEIIGLTRYYNFEWDPEDEAPRRKESVSPEDEQKMLAEFAASHKLRHRFAVQGESSTTAEYYGVTSIPHVVLIDQQGKIRLIRVGSSSANVKAIDEMLEKLFSSTPDATGG